MATADGYINIVVNMDVDEAERELRNLDKEMLSLEKRKATKNALLDGVRKQAEEVNAKLEEARQTLAELQESTPGLGGHGAENLYEEHANAIAAQEEIVKGLEAEQKRLTAEENKYAKQLEQVNAELDTTRQIAAEATQALEEKQAEAEAEAYRHSVEGLNEELEQLLQRQQELQSYGLGIGLGAERRAKINAELSDVNQRIEEVRDELQQLKEDGEQAGDGIADGASTAGDFIDKLGKKLTSMLKRVFVFSVITKALRGVRDWISNVVKSDESAVAAIAQLKAALLTLVQPLVGVIIPAFTKLVQILTKVVTAAAQFVSMLFGTTLKESAKAADALYDEQKAIKGVGSAADKASESLAGFDEINTIGSENKSGSSSTSIIPDFSGIEDFDWLKGIMGDVAGWLTAAALLGGIALVAIGAATGKLGLVLAGLALIGTGVYIGTETGTFQHWADALGLRDVEEFATIALLLGGIALIAIGAITGNILTILAGLGLLGAGIYVGTESETLKHWAETLGLNSVFDYVVVAIQLAGIALIAFGAIKGSLFLVLSGMALIAAGIIAQSVGEEKLAGWWETLKLTSVMQWVSVASLLAGIALVAIGAATANLLLILFGMGLLYIGAVAGGKDNRLEDWVTVLGLQKVAGWVTAALMLAGMALVVFGIITVNILMILAGIVFLGAGIAVGTTSGTFSDWVDSLGLRNVPAWVSTALQLGGVALVAIGAATMNLPLVLAGLALLGVGSIGLGGTSGSSGVGNISSYAGVNSFPTIPTNKIPHLAKGAVIPANREFMAVLGDQKSGTNIEAPADLIKQMVSEALQENGGSSNSRPAEIKIFLDKRVLARVMVGEINDMTIEAGRSVLKV